MAGTEATIRALLRYLHGDMNTLLSIPSVGYADHSHENLDKAAYIHAFSDASHGPYRFNGRRSYTSACREIHKHPCKRWGGGHLDKFCWQRMKLRLTNGLGLV